MEREFNYPSAKTDTSPDAGRSPGQTDVGREVYTDLVVWQGWETGSRGSPLGWQMVECS